MPPRTDRSPAPRRAAAMPFIMTTVLIDMLAIGLIVPVLPMLVASFTPDKAAQALWFGAISFAFGIANFFGSPILGALSDRHGRRPVLLIGFSGLALSFFATAWVGSLWALLAVRAIAGGLQANIAVANAYVADISSPEDRARRFGMLGAMFGIGFILGPVMGGLLGAIDLDLPFYAAGGLALLNLLYGWRVLPESLPAERRRAVNWRSANPVSSLMALGRLQGVGALVAVIALNNLAQYVLHTCWVLYTNFRFGWGPLENGWSLCAVGVVSVIVQGGLMRHLLRRFGAAQLATFGLVSSATSYLMWGLATQGWMMYAVIGFNLLGFTVAAALQSLVSNAAGEREQGQTMGAVASINSLMAVMAPVLGAPLLGAVSHLPASDWRLGAPFFFCAALQVAATLIALRRFGNWRRVPASAAADASSA